MPEPWEALKDETLAVLRAGVSDIVDDFKPDLNYFLEQVAAQAAREKWRTLHASGPEKAIAEQNLRHLAAQAKGEAVRVNLALSAHAKTILDKVLDTAIGLLIRILPVLL